MAARPRYELRPGIRPSRRPLACHHEAGHALARWYFGHAFDRVVVLSTGQVAGGHRLREGRGAAIAGPTFAGQGRWREP
ncbi:MAG: hypothetical protein JOY66_09280 [Acetobacteraceae bacterium]|nr:hypothetical protein [Acetobacteraceae bacterium]